MYWRWGTGTRTIVVWFGLFDGDVLSENNAFASTTRRCISIACLITRLYVCDKSAVTKDLDTATRPNSLM